MPRTRAMASRRSRTDSARDSIREKAFSAAREFIAHAARTLHNGGPARLAVIGGISALGLIVLGLQFSSAPDEPAAGMALADRPVAIEADAVAAITQTNRAETDLTINPASVETASGTETEIVAALAEPLPLVPAPDGPPEHTWHYVHVAPGDTMETIFRRLGLSPRLLHQVVNLDARTGSLVDLRPGDEIAFDIDDNNLNALRTEYDDENWLFVERTDEALASRLEARNLEVRVAEVEAEITSSLFNAGKNAGLSDNMILRLAGIFGWDIDFALDIRRGDRFALVFEEIYRDDQFLRQGAILGARFINQGKSFEAVRFDDGSGPDYYDPEGRPMRKAFLRAPINFTRVSSNFNPRRLHPVTRRVRPHNGTDYAAPTGTPVWAAGDGTVLEAGYTRPNGNYIFLKHGNHIVTRYLHLSKKLVKRGDRVRQGQSIGLVGATGLATGPHLHYEFLVNDRHRDPRKVDLPEVEPLPADLLPEYKAHAGTWLARLEELLPPKVMLASSSGESPSAPESRPQTTTAPK
ncbi:MAG: peptidoglycan DD-metalloendopeptidase family protein [Wenzhouxiangellaceae bacterium]